MDSALLILTGIAVAIVVLAMTLTRLFGKSGSKRQNSSSRDGAAQATWIGVNRAERDFDADR